MRSATLIWVAMALVGCRSPWDRHDESLYAAMKEPSVATAQAHSELIHQILENARERGTRPPAGMSAEYAYYLAKLGRSKEAKAALELGAKHYPEAKTFLKVFERFLEGVTPLAHGGGGRSK